MSVTKGKTPSGVSWAWEADGLLVWHLRVKRKVKSVAPSGKESTRTISRQEGYILKDQAGMWRGYTQSLTGGKYLGDSSDVGATQRMVTDALALTK